MGGHLLRGKDLCPCLCSDPSQSDPETKDFWLNMAALTEALQHQAEQNPTASYYNLVLLRYQVGRARHALASLRSPALCWPRGVLSVVRVLYSAWSRVGGVAGQGDSSSHLSSHS